MMGKKYWFGFALERFTGYERKEGPRDQTEGKEKLVVMDPRLGAHEHDILCLVRVHFIVGS